MKLLKENKESCYGCGACADLCPKGIIHMEADEEGFRYAVFDETQCIGCNRCLKGCPALDQPESDAEREIYALRRKEPEELKKSTSGGSFSLLAEAVIRNGGCVCGAKFDEQFRVVHDFADTVEQMQAMRKSKYVQSNLQEKDVFAEVFKRIQTQQVLFVGTPCQVDSMRRFILTKKGNMENLVLCDLICGKATSPGVWEDYKKALETMAGGKLTDFTFRDKKYGWNHARSSAFVNGKNCSDLVDAKCNWLELHAKGAFSRPSCYTCPFAAVKRNSDLTIGDFWGIEKSLPRFADERGVNVVIIHSPKGKELVEQIKPQADFVISDAVSCRQDRLCFPEKRPENRQEFWDVYTLQGFDSLRVQYGQRGFVKRMIYNVMLPFARKIKLYDFLWKVYHKIK